jgi:DNA-directed RNA polymerase subunit F
MVKPEIIEKAPISIPLLKEELKNIKKRDGELTFRGGKTEEYLNDFSKLSKKDVEELLDKLGKLDIPRLKEEFMHKIIDLMPTSVAELKVILQGYTLTINNDNLAKIMGVVKNYLPKK